MGLVLIILIALVVLIGLGVLLIYNRMVSRRNAVDNSWAQIEAALKRRHDLIPNLVEAVKGYATHERETFESVTKARSTAVAAQAPPQQAGAESFLDADARPPDGRRRAVPRAARDRELPAAPGRALGDREPDPDHPPRLQRHGPDLQHVHPGLPALGGRQRLRLRGRASSTTRPPTPRRPPRSASTSRPAPKRRRPPRPPQPRSSRAARRALLGLGLAGGCLLPRLSRRRRRP